MKSKKRVITVVVLALAGVALIALPTAAFRGRAGGMGMGKGMGPTFTDDQMEKIEKIHDRYNDERTELTNRLKVIMLEADDAVADDTPDFDAIERRIDEMMEVKGDLAKLRLKIHKEIRPLLDDDQKVLFDRRLGRLLHGKGGRGKGHPGMMGHGGMRGCMMGGSGGKCGPDGKGGPGGGHPGMMGRGGMGGGMPGHAGMGGGAGYQMMPWCPFADTDLDE
jgi:Spy/CpxP family protein refolding chaperone